MWKVLLYPILFSDTCHKWITEMQRQSGKVYGSKKLSCKLLFYFKVSVFPGKLKSYSLEHIAEKNVWHDSWCCQLPDTVFSLYDLSFPQVCIHILYSRGHLTLSAQALHSDITASEDPHQLWKSVLSKPFLLYIIQWQHILLSITEYRNLFTIISVCWSCSPFNVPVTCIDTL